MDCLKDITVAFTGYRPEKIRLSSSNPDIEKEIRSALGRIIQELYNRGFRRFLSGMAQGFDLWAADEVLALRRAGECPDLSLTAAIPFRGQDNSYPAGSSELYGHILAEADNAEVLSEFYYPDCYRQRNDWMVENSSLVVCYFDGQPGGTQYTVRCARKMGLQIINLLEPSLLF